MKLTELPETATGLEQLLNEYILRQNPDRHEYCHPAIISREASARVLACGVTFDKKVTKHHNRLSNMRHRLLVLISMLPCPTDANWTPPYKDGPEKQVSIFFGFLTRKLTQTKMYENTFRVVATLAVALFKDATILILQCPSCCYPTISRIDVKPCNLALICWTETCLYAKPSERGIQRCEIWKTTPALYLTLPPALNPINFRRSPLPRGTDSQFPPNLRLPEILLPESRTTPAEISFDYEPCTKFRVSLANPKEPPNSPRTTKTNYRKRSSTGPDEPLRKRHKTAVGFVNHAQPLLDGDVSCRNNPDDSHSHRARPPKKDNIRNLASSSWPGLIDISAVRIALDSSASPEAPPRNVPSDGTPCSDREHYSEEPFIPADLSGVAAHGASPSTPTAGNEDYMEATPTAGNEDCMEAVPLSLFHKDTTHGGVLDGWDSEDAKKLSQMVMTHIAPTWEAAWNRRISNVEEHARLNQQVTENLTSDNKDIRERVAKLASKVAALENNDLPLTGALETSRPPLIWPQECDAVEPTPLYLKYDVRKRNRVDLRIRLTGASQTCAPWILDLWARGQRCVGILVPKEKVDLFKRNMPGAAWTTPSEDPLLEVTTTDSDGQSIRVQAGCIRMRTHMRYAAVTRLPTVMNWHTNVAAATAKQLIHHGIILKEDFLELCEETNDKRRTLGLCEVPEDSF